MTVTRSRSFRMTSLLVMCYLALVPGSRLDADGWEAPKAVEATVLGSFTGRTSLVDMAVDYAGNRYLVGSLYGTDAVDLGSGIAVSGSIPEETHAVILKLGPEGETEWARALIDTPYGSSFLGVAVNAAGDIYVCGYVKGTGTYDFGNDVSVEPSAFVFNEPAGAATALVLVKYDAAGHALWARTLGGDQNPTLYNDVAVDVFGNVYAVGSCTTARYSRGNFARLELGNGVAVTPGSGDLGRACLVVKYDSDGNAIWARSIGEGSTSGSSYQAITIGQNGRVHAIGYVQKKSHQADREHSYTFGDGESFAISRRYDAAFIATYDAEGAVLWVQPAGGDARNVRLTCATVDQAGAVYVAGQSGSGEGIDVGTARVFLIQKYDATGELLWRRWRTEPFASGQAVPSVALDATGTLYAALEYGSIQVPLRQSPSAVQMVRMPVAFAAFEPTGGPNAVTWESADQPRPSARMHSICVDANDRIHIAGTLSGAGTCDFGNGTVAESTGDRERAAWVFVTYDGP